MWDTNERLTKTDGSPPMTRKDAALRLNVSERTVDRYIAAGQLKAIQYVRRGKILIEPEVIEKFKTGCVKKAGGLRDKSVDNSNQQSSMPFEAEATAPRRMVTR